MQVFIHLGSLKFSFSERDQQDIQVITNGEWYPITSEYWACLATRKSPYQHAFPSFLYNMPFSSPSDLCGVHTSTLCICTVYRLQNAMRHISTISYGYFPVCTLTIREKTILLNCDAHCPIVWFTNDCPEGIMHACLGKHRHGQI